MHRLRGDNGFSMMDTLVALLLTGIVFAITVPLFNALISGIVKRSEDMLQAVTLINFHGRLYRLAEEVRHPYWSPPHPSGDKLVINVSNEEAAEFLATEDGIEIHRNGTRYVYRFPVPPVFAFSERAEGMPAGFLVRFEGMDDVIIPFAEQAARSSLDGE